MYSLPANTLINQPLYKKTVFEKFNLKTAERERFDADISKMAWWLVSLLPQFLLWQKVRR